MLQLSRLGYASPLPIRIAFDLDGRTEMSSYIWQNYFPQDHWSVYPAYKHDNEPRGGFGLVFATGMYLPLGTWFFPNFKQDFLLNGKRVKCLRRNVGPARRLTLPLPKGDWTRWVTLLAEPTFCNLNGSPCFVNKCVKRCLSFREARVGGWPFCSRQIFVI